MKRRETSCCGLLEIQNVCDKNLDRLVREVVDAKDRSYGMIYATTVKAGPHLNRALTGLNFKRVTRFANPRSGNIVTLWYNNLNSFKLDQKLKEKVWGRTRPKSASLWRLV